MAHKASQGSTALGRDSQSKRLGIKKFAGEKVLSGNIIVRQKGTKYRPGIGVMMGRDFTIFAVKEGKVNFKHKKIKGYDGNLKLKTLVNVI